MWPQEPRTARCAGLPESRGHQEELRQTLLKLVTLTCGQYLKKDRYKESRSDFKSTRPLFENYHLTGLLLIKAQRTEFPDAVFTLTFILTIN